MTMQGISLVMSGSSNTSSVKSTKATDATFESFMSERASKVETAENVAAAPKTEKPDAKEFVSVKEERATEVTPKQEELGQDPETVVTNPETKNVKSEETLEVVEVEAMVEQAMVILQEVFGVSESDMKDILEQLGMEIKDLLFQVQDGMVKPVNVDMLKQLVMGVHGIEDQAAFITNGTLNQELTMLTEQLTVVVAKGLSVMPEELQNMDQNLMLDFAEQFQKMAETIDADVAPQDIEVLKQDVKVAEEIQTEVQDAVVNAPDKITVTVETETSSGQQSFANMEQTTAQTSQTTEVTTDAQTVQENALNLFTERLEQAFAQNGVEEVQSSERLMTEIVEQVVTKIRIRVMPETTSMDLQLNPENLGRVNLHVASTNGVATAVLTVENQFVKEALESQLVMLKENFNEQGLKVEDVEVTVADFGLKQQDEQAKEQAENKSGNKKFRAQAGEGVMTEEDDIANNMTESDRRDANSVVDYTA